jgi:hypothetical protein
MVLKHKASTDDSGDSMTSPSEGGDVLLDPSPPLSSPLFSSPLLSFILAFVTLGVPLLLLPPFPPALVPLAADTIASTCACIKAQ